MSRGPSAPNRAVADGSLRADITPIGEKPAAAGREIDFDRVSATIITDANSITPSSQKECLCPARTDIEVGDSP
jgi:hypothetical protein